MDALILIVAFSFLGCQTFAEDELPESDHILLLNASNIDQAISQHPHIMINFFAPWCGHCKVLNPEFKQAAHLLHKKSSPLRLGQVEGPNEPAALLAKYNVTGYPSVWYFRNGQANSYKHSRFAADIVEWLEKKSGPPAKHIQDYEGARNLKNEEHVSVFGYFDGIQSENAIQFSEAAFQLEDIKFVIISDIEIWKQLGLNEENRIVLFRKFDDPQELYKGSIHTEAIVRWVKVERLPYIVEYSHDAAQLALDGTIMDHVILFVRRSSPDYDTFIREARPVAKNLRHKMIFISVDVDDEEYHRVVEYFGMQLSDVPNFWIVRLRDDLKKIIRFKPTKAEITEKNIRQFTEDYLNGKVTRHYKSIPLAKDWNVNQTKTIVRENFDELVLDKTKDVLVMFFAPWCGHCKNLDPVLLDLAKGYANNKDILIARIDATANEIEGLEVDKFPTIILFKKGTNERSEYGGLRTLEALKNFVDSGGSTGKKTDEKSDVDKMAKLTDEL